MIFVLHHKSTGKKRGSGTYSTDWENEASKIFIISPRLIGCVGKDSKLFKFSGPYSEIRPSKLTNSIARTNWDIINIVIGQSYYICVGFSTLEWKNIFVQLLDITFTTLKILGFISSFLPLFFSGRRVAELEMHLFVCKVSGLSNFAANSGFISV